MSQRWDVFKCPDCPQTEQKLWDLELLKQHYAKKHMNNFYLFSCPKCPKKFASLLAAKHNWKLCGVSEDTDVSKYTRNLQQIDKNEILKFNSVVRRTLEEYVQRVTAVAPLTVDFGVQVSTNEEKMMLNTYTQTDEMAPFHNSLSDIKKHEIDTSYSNMDFEHKTPPLTPAEFLSNWDTMTRTSGSSTRSRLSSLEEKPMSHYEQKPVPNRDPRLRKRSIENSSSTCNSAREAPVASISSETSTPIPKFDEPQTSTVNGTNPNHSNGFDEPKMKQPAMEASNSFDGTGQKEIDVFRRSVGREDRPSSSAATLRSPRISGETSHGNTSSWKKEVSLGNGRVRMESFATFRMVPIKRSESTSFKSFLERKVRERDEMNEAPSRKKMRTDYPTDDQNMGAKRPSELKTKNTNDVTPNHDQGFPSMSPAPMNTDSQEGIPKTPESPPPPLPLSYEEPNSIRSNHHQEEPYPTQSLSLLSPPPAPPRFPSIPQSDPNTFNVSPPISKEQTNLLAPVPPPPGFGIPKPKNFFVPPPSGDSPISQKEDNIRMEFLIETEEKDACIQFTSSTKKIKKMYFPSQFLSTVSSVFERQLRTYPRDAQKVIRVNHGSHSFTDAMVMITSSECMFPLGCLPDNEGIDNETRLLRMLTASEEFGLADVRTLVQKKLFADMCISVHGSDCIHCIDRVTIALRYQLHIPEQVKFTDMATNQWILQAKNKHSMANRLQVRDKVFRFLRPLF